MIKKIFLILFISVVFNSIAEDVIVETNSVCHVERGYHSWKRVRQIVLRGDKIYYPDRSIVSEPLNISSNCTQHGGKVSIADGKLYYKGSLVMGIKNPSHFYPLPHDPAFESLTIENNVSYGPFSRKLTKFTSSSGVGYFLGDIIKDDESPNIIFNNNSLEQQCNSEHEKTKFLYFDPAKYIIYFSDSNTKVINFEIQVNDILEGSGNVVGSGVLSTSIDSNIEPAKEYEDENNIFKEYLIPDLRTKIKNFQTYTITASDNIGNPDSSKSITFQRDDVAPDTFNPGTPKLSIVKKEEGIVGYQYVMPYIAIDELSGIDEVKSEIAPYDEDAISYPEDFGEMDTKAIDEDAGKYTSTVNIWTRDIIYRMDSYAKDNVSNTRKLPTKLLMLSAAAVIDDGGLVEENKPKFIRKLVNGQSKLHLDGKLDLGLEVNHEEFGLEKVEFIIVDERDNILGKLGEINDFSRADPDDKRVKKDNGGNTIVGKEMLFSFPLDINGMGLTPHKAIKINVVTHHKQKNRITPKETTPYYTEDPLPDEEIRGLQLKIGNNEYTLDKNSYKYINNEENKDIVPMDLITKLDQDVVELIYTKDPLEIVVVQSNDSDSISYDTVDFEGNKYVVVNETFTEHRYNTTTGELITKPNVTKSYLLTGYKFKPDSGIVTDGINVVIQGSNGLDNIVQNSDVEVKLNKIPTEDISGINEVVFFNVEDPSIVGDIEAVKIYYRDGTFEEGINKLTAVISVPHDEAIDNPYRAYKLPVFENNEGTAYVAARLKDRAGNTGFLLPTKVEVDGIVPGTITESNLEYSYTHSDLTLDKITLKVKPLVDEDSPKDKFSDYTITVNSAVSGVSVVNNDIVIELGADFVPNDPIDLEVTMTDEALNQRVNNLRFYTPGKITFEDVTVEHKWDEVSGNTITFGTGLLNSGVAVYRDGIKVNRIDSNLDPHGVYRYTFYSVNGSGYENRKAGSFAGDIDITVANNLPSLVITDNFMRDDQDRIYLGPKSKVNFGVEDKDPDYHEVYLSVNDIPELQDVEVEGTEFTLESLFGFEVDKLAEGETYTFKLGVKDFWGTNNEVSGDTIPFERTFVYDKEPPVKGETLYETRDNYTFIHGNLYLKVSDTGIGMESEAVKAFKYAGETEEELVVTAITDPVYTHKVDLPEGTYNIVVKTYDRVGNADNQLIQKAINVDRTAPVVSETAWGENPNFIAGDNRLSTRNSNFAVTWNDNLSSPAYVEYEFTRSGTVVSSGTKEVKGLSQSLDSTGSINISLYNDAESIVPKSDYKLNITIKDRGGNVSGKYTTPFGMQYDLEAPVVELNNWNAVTKGGVNYVNTTALPEPDVTITDSTDGVLSPLYRVKKVSTGVKTAEFANISDISIAGDGKYELEIVGRDRSGHKTALSVPFTYDVTPPSNLGINFNETKKESYKGGEAVSVNFTGTDVETFYYQLLPNEEWIEVRRSFASPYTLTVPRKDGVETERIVVKLKAFDIAGNFSSEVVPAGGNILVDNTGEYLNVNITSWIGKNGKITGVWEYFPGKDNDDGEVNSYHYELYRVRSSNHNKIAEGVTESRTVTHTVIDPMEEGDRYYFKVSAVMSSSRETMSFISIKAVNDFTEPVVNSLTTDSYATAENIVIEWDVTDNIMVSNIKAALSWTSGDVTEYGEIIDLGQVSSGSALITGNFTSRLKTGDRVKIDLIAEDAAGNTSVKESDTIVIDNSAPPEFGVVDQGEFINPVLNPDFYFEWIWSEDDSDSPIEKIYYQLTENGVLTDNWVEADKDRRELEVAIPDEFKAIAKNGTTVIAAVKKVNAAGLSTVGFSNGITLDSTAGKIIDARFTFRRSDLDRVYYTNQRELTLWISGYDNESGISRLVGELGYFSGCRWIKYSEGGIDELTTDGKLDITLPDEIVDNGRFRYKIVWYNKTGTPSRPFYTRELVYNPAKPVISDLKASYSNGRANLNWNSNFSVPFNTGEIKLKSGAFNRTFSLAGNNGTFSTDTAIADGEYHFTAEMTDVADGSTGVKQSNNFIKDTTKPELEYFDADTYVSTKLSFKVRANEDISRYSYKLGVIDFDSYFTGGWVEGLNNGNQITVDNHDLTQYSDLGFADQSYLVLTVKFADRYGNWSDEDYALIRVDLTAPSKPVVNMDRNINFLEKDITLSQSVNFSSTELQNIIWSSEDDISRIKGYSFTVVNDPTAPIPAGNWSEVLPVDRSGSYNVNLDGLSLSDGEKAYAVIRSVNGAGLYSEPGYSEEITVDLKAPEFTLDFSAEAGKTDINGTMVSTFNGEGAIGLNIDNEVSGHIHINAKTYDPLNHLIADEKDHIDMGETTTLQIPFRPTADIYGEYKIEITLSDPGENRTTVTEVIRYNSPPAATPPDLVKVNPLRPYSLDGFSWFQDSDDIDNVSYKVMDGETVLVDESTLTALEVALTHKNVRNSETEYNLTVDATDKLGASTLVELPLKVVNTSEGRLFTDEYWSGDHIVTGSITVPDTLKLTLLDGAIVKVETDAINGYDQTITIAENAELDHEGTAKYYSDDPYGNWGGLVINGKADLSSITVENAERGVTINSITDFVIDNSVFANNVTGIHLVKSGTVSIDNSEFRGNRFYGIKEEKGVDPVVTNSLFTDNGYDYYDTDMTVIDYTKLNQLDLNSGNRGE